jgi:hypothetical protein
MKTCLRDAFKKMFERKSNLAEKYIWGYLTPHTLQSNIYKGMSFMRVCDTLLKNICNGTSYFTEKHFWRYALAYRRTSLNLQLPCGRTCLVVTHTLTEKYLWGYVISHRRTLLKVGHILRKNIFRARHMLWKNIFRVRHVLRKNLYRARHMLRKNIFGARHKLLKNIRVFESTSYRTEKTSCVFKETSRMVICFP